MSIQSNGYVSSNSGFSLDMFRRTQLEQIHVATLTVLSKTGVRVESRQAAELYAAFGAQVQQEDGYSIVRIPSGLVEDAIARAPKKVIYHGRNPANDFASDSVQPGFATFGECTQIIDLVNCKIRDTIKQDCFDTALICDALDEIRLFDSTVNPSDTPVVSQVLHNAQATFTNITKHAYLGPGNAREVQALIEIASACLGDEQEFINRPIFSSTVCPASPLILFEGVCDVIIESARSNVGLIIYPMPLAGITGPITLAGTLVNYNAEVLSALVLAQFAKSGTPCTYACASTVMDLKKAVVPTAAPEMVLLNSAAAKLAQFYQLPCLISAGLSDSKLPDAQAGYEAAYSLTACALSGAPLISGAGTIDLGATFDYAKLIMDTELFRLVKTLRSGIEVSEETLAIEVTNQVGAGNDFLRQKHTLRHLREQYRPGLYDRNLREIWQDQGGADLTQQAYQKAQEILATHCVIPLPDGAPEKIASIIEAYEKEFV